MRLIDADALLYDLEIAPLTGDGGVDVNDLDDIIKRQPTIEERKKGKWNTYYHGGTEFSYSCARCGYGAPFDMKGGKVFPKKWNYCPNCGAKMEGEK